MPCYNIQLLLHKGYLATSACESQGKKITCCSPVHQCIISTIVSISMSFCTNLNQHSSFSRQTFCTPRAYMALLFFLRRATDIPAS